MKFAEDAAYWDTTVHPARSQGEVTELLENFGASAVMTAQGVSDGRVAWMIRFQYLDRAYRFVFTPLPCRAPGKVWSVGGKKMTGEERARYQMGRIAVHFIKAILTAAEMNLDALFGFLELEHGGRVVTAAELDVDRLTAALPAIEIYPRLEG